jgi:hypothetical protein
MKNIGCHWCSRSKTNPRHQTQKQIIFTDCNRCDKTYCDRCIRRQPEIEPTDTGCLWCTGNCCCGISLQCSMFCFNATAPGNCIKIHSNKNHKCCKIYKRNQTRNQIKLDKDLLKTKINPTVFDTYPKPPTFIVPSKSLSRVTNATFKYKPLNISCGNTLCSTHREGSTIKNVQKEFISRFPYPW